MKLDHIVIQSNIAKCLHCGSTYQIWMPCPISIFEAIVTQFLKMHRDCKKGWK